MARTVSDRAPDHGALRAAGMRPIQIWVRDTTRNGFAEECRRQAAIIAAADLADRDLTDFMDSALEDEEGCS